jgi:5-methyltetrahydrofolate--homocysteine methyltransferase
MLIIGESINGTIPSVGTAILEHNESFLSELAKEQIEKGAQMLDINAGVAEGNEVEDLPWLVSLVQKKVPCPLMIDSNNPEALGAALKVYNHREPPIVNSISGEKKKRETILPLIFGKRCRIVALCMGDQGIPATPEKRVEVARQLDPILKEAGIPLQNIYFDPLVLSLGLNWEGAMVTLKTIELLKKEFPESHMICGLSNIGVELPLRRLVNRSFLPMAAYAGLDTFLIDVRDKALTSTLIASTAIIGKDPDCSMYLKSYRMKKLIE